MYLHRFIAFGLVGMVLLLTFKKNIAQDSFQVKHMEVALRMVGHQVLLKSGDSLSRVMPVTKNNEQFQVKFESDFSVNPEDLTDIVDSVLLKADITRQYILEVRNCDTDEVVYSFEMNDRGNNDIVPCRSRVLPMSCYYLMITFSDDTREMTNEHALPTGPPGRGGSNQSYWVLFSLLAVMVPVGVAVWRRRSRSAQDPNIIQLGQYYFDRKNATLIIKDQRTELTAKEADLLTLLYESGNDTVKREEILQQVWEDEGDYIGRTLDVYISKLRKKLIADPGVKIVNVRGVGYKLVIDV